MKKVFALAIVILLCLAVALPVAATDDADVASPSGKNILVSASMNGEDVEGCVVVTTVEQAEKKVTDITQEERDLLLDVYSQLEDGTMTLPIDGEYVIRDVMDISFKYSECRVIEEHNHKDVQLKEIGVVLDAELDLGIGSEELCVLTYIDGEWTEIEKVTNNGDGTVTCIFEDLCPVAFVVVG